MPKALQPNDLVLVLWHIFKKLILKILKNNSGLHWRFPWRGNTVILQSALYRWTSYQSSLDSCPLNKFTLIVSMKPAQIVLVA